MDSGSDRGNHGLEGILHGACEESGGACGHADTVGWNMGPTLDFLPDSGSFDVGPSDSGRLDTGGEPAPGDEAIDCFAHGLAHLVRALGPTDALACAARVILQMSGADREISNLPGMGIPGMGLPGVGDRTHFRPWKRVSCPPRGA